MGGRTILATAGLLLSAALLGCAGRGGLAHGLCRVTGTVVLSDRRDLPRLQDCSVAARSVADPTVETRGPINDVDGTFELSTTRQENGRFVVLEGVPPGEYQVRIESPDPRAVPARYTDFAKSGLTFTAVSGDNDIRLPLSLR